MVKSYWITSLFMLVSMLVYGQSALTGIIVDSTNSPVPFAIVALHATNDSVVIKGTPSDENGIFSLTGISSGNYFLSVSSMSYEETSTASFVYDSLKGLAHPIIILKNQVALEEVTISAIRPTIEFANGNTYVNVSNSALAKGNSVFDLLAKMPGVSIDKNVISIQGKSGVVVMIDHRMQYMNDDQLANLLRSMNAESVERIEILRNPPSRYDAGGTSGMINIITKKNTQIGFTGSVYVSTAQGIYNNSAAGVSINYKNEHISIFSSIDGSDGWFVSRMKHDRYFQTDSGSTLMKNKNDWKERQSGLQFNVGADWFPDSKNTIGFKIDGGPGAYTSYGIGSDSVFGYNDLGFDQLQSVLYIPNKWNIINYNLNAEHAFDTTGTRISFSADYTDGSENDRSLSDNHFYNSTGTETLAPSIFQNRNNSSMNIVAGKIDFTKTIDSASSFECGTKVSLVDIRNDYELSRKDTSDGFYYVDPLFSNRYNYNEKTFAAYAVYSHAWSKLNMQLGLRVEQTQVHGKNPDTGYELRLSYFNPFPNLSFAWSVNDNHQLQLNLNRRINRPVFDDLNPFVYFQNPFSYYQGNPQLKPDYSYYGDITHSYSDWLVNTVSYERVENIMLNYTIQDDSTKIFLESIKNMKFQNSITYSIFVQRDIQPWWSVVVSGFAQFVEYKGEVGTYPFTNTTFTYRANMMNTITLPKEFILEVSGFYRGPGIYATTYINRVWMVSAAVKKSFFDDKLSCSIGMNNIFNSMKFHTHANFSNQNWNFYYSDDSRRITLSLSYNFGTAEVNQRDTNSNGDEKDRLNL